MIPLLMPIDLALYLPESLNEYIRQVVKNILFSAENCHHRLFIDKQNKYLYNRSNEFT